MREEVAYRDTFVSKNYVKQKEKENATTLMFYSLYDEDGQKIGSKKVNYCHQQNNKLPFN